MHLVLDKASMNSFDEVNCSYILSKKSSKSIQDMRLVAYAFDGWMAFALLSPFYIWMFIVIALLGVDMFYLVCANMMQTDKKMEY